MESKVDQLKRRMDRRDSIGHVSNGSANGTVQKVVVANGHSTIDSNSRNHIVQSVAPRRF